MENFVIHIFGYGETQINSNELSIKVPTGTLKEVTPLIQAIFNLKPAGNNSVISDYHAINIFDYTDIRWLSRTTADSFSLKDRGDLTSLIDVLIAELNATLPLN